MQQTKSTWRNNEYLQPEWLAVACFGLLFVGFVASRACISIGMIGLVVAAMWRTNIITLFRHYFQRKELWALAFFFVPVFYSGIYSEHTDQWLNWVRIKLPYLVLPLAFAGLTQLNRKQITITLYSFLFVMFLSLIVVLINYALHYTEVTESMLRGNAIQMPFSHIRYTLMLAFSVFVALYLYESDAARPFWLIGFALAIFLALHILAVRSGLLALYAGVLVYLLRWMVIHKKYGFGLIVIALLAALPILAYWYVPSFQNKIAHTIYDLQEMKAGVINYRYDAMRLVSMKAGLMVWGENVLCGVGAGDLSAAMNNFYARHYPQLDEQNRLLPHHQFIWVLAGLGLVGLFQFLMAFYLPFFANGNYKQWIFVVLHLILFTSFFTEHTLEEQIGTAFYLIFLLLFIQRFKLNA